MYGHVSGGCPVRWRSRCEAGGVCDLATPSPGSRRRRGRPRCGARSNSPLWAIGPTICASLPWSPRDAYPDNAGPHDYTRAVLNANPPPLQRHRARTRRRQSRLAVACLAGLLAFGLVHSASAETWRSLPALGSPGCVILDTRSGPVADALEWDRSAQCSPCFPSTWSCLVPCSV